MLAAEEQANVRELGGGGGGNAWRKGASWCV